MTPRLRVGIHGTGHFGYALMRHLESKVGRTIEMCAYDRDSHVRESLGELRRHPFDHVSSPLGASVRIMHSVRELMADLDVLVLAVPSVSTREVAGAVGAVPWKRPLIMVNTAKALDYRTGRRLSEVVAQVMRRPPRPMTYAALSGGTIAGELLRQNPLGVTIASRSSRALATLQALFAAPNMWVQTSHDVTGVELAGAFKNVVSICSGMVRGLDLSYGAETHLISRMAGEIEDFCVCCQRAQRRTFSMTSQCWGSDLWMSCTGPTRNRALGQLLGEGKSLAQASRLMKQQHMTVEGVATLKSLGRLLRRFPRELPLLRTAEKIILHGAPPRSLINALMNGEARR